MLHAVHTEAAAQHQHQDDENRGFQLLLFPGQHLRDGVEGVIVDIDPEQPEDTDDAEDPEGHRPLRKKEGQEGGEETQQIHDAAEGTYIRRQGAQLRLLGKQVFRGKQPQKIIHQEKCDGHRLRRRQQGTVWTGNGIKGVQDGDRQIHRDKGGDENIIGPADQVVGRAHLHHLGDPGAYAVELCHFHGAYPPPFLRFQNPIFMLAIRGGFRYNGGADTN